MNMKTAVLTCLNKYFDFSGRARRSEYWYFCLALTLFNVVVGAILGVLGSFGDLLSKIIALAVFCPSLAVAVRRMHDIGKSGFAVLIVLIPLVGAILYLVWLARDSVPGTNQYGANPKGMGDFGAYTPYGQSGYGQSSSSQDRYNSDNNSYKF